MHNAPVWLYVEDEDAAAFLLETAIKEGEIPVELYRVADGEQALAYLTHGEGFESVPDPDLILLDLNLPRKNGLEVLAELQHAGSMEKSPVVVFTSSTLPRDRKRALALGASEYLNKPKSFHELVAALRSTLLRFGQAGSIPAYN